MSLTGNPYIDTAIVAYGLFLMGRLSVKNRTEEIIENTVDHLIREGYIKTEYDENGDVILLKASKD
jgi:hypothetical protein